MPALNEASQAERWRCEVDANLAAPMARGEGDKDFFVDEPCLVSYGDNIEVVIPTRWYQRDKETYARVHPIIVTADGFVVDGRPNSCFDIPLSYFFLNIADLQTEICQQTYSLPEPKIQGTNLSHRPQKIVHTDTS